MEGLYRAIEEILGTKYPVSWQYIDERASEVVGVYLYESSNDKRYMDGEYMYESIKAHIQVNCKPSMDGIQEALRYLRDFVDIVEDTNVDNGNIEFVDCTHVGPKAIPIGKNEYKIPICRTVLDIKYLIREE